MKNPLTDKTPFWLRFSLVVIFVLVIIIFIQYDFYHREKRVQQGEQETKTYLHVFQIGLERYAEDNGGNYPSDLNSLLYEEYFACFPTNPWTDSPMRNIPFGTQPSRGEFTYLPVFRDCEVTGCYLIAYGPEDGSNMGYWDIDGDGSNDNVILILTDGKRPDLDVQNDPLLRELLNPPVRPGGTD